MLDACQDKCMEIHAESLIWSYNTHEYIPDSLLATPGWDVSFFPLAIPWARSAVGAWKKNDTVKNSEVKN